jgi:hypothetical protein
VHAPGNSFFNCIARGHLKICDFHDTEAAGRILVEEISYNVACLINVMKDLLTFVVSVHMHMITPQLARFWIIINTVNRPRAACLPHNNVAAPPPTTGGPVSSN